MPISRGGVGFEELERSPTINVSPQGTSARRRFRLPIWNQWDAFVGELYGVTIDVNGQVVATKPLPFPGMAGLVVDEISVEPYDATVAGSYQTLTDGVNGCGNGAVVTVVYKQLSDSSGPPFPDGMVNVPEGVYFTVERDYGVDFLTARGMAWKWSDTGKQLSKDVQIGIRRPKGTYQITAHNVRRVNDPAIREATGKLNLNSIDFFGMSFEPETLFYEGASVVTSFRFQKTGVALYQVKHSFVSCQSSWQQFFRESDAGFAAVVSADGTGKKPYEVSDFHELFQEP